MTLPRNDPPDSRTARRMVALWVYADYGSPGLRLHVDLENGETVTQPLKDLYARGPQAEASPDAQEARQDVPEDEDDLPMTDLQRALVQTLRKHGPLTLDRLAELAGPVYCKLRGYPPKKLNPGQLFRQRRKGDLHELVERGTVLKSNGRGYYLPDQDPP